MGGVLPIPELSSGYLSYSFDVLGLFLVVWVSSAALLSLAPTLHILLNFLLFFFPFFLTILTKKNLSVRANKAHSTA